MNRLTTQDRVRILTVLSEGMDVNAACRVTGASKNTVLKLLADVGAAQREHQQCHGGQPQQGQGVVAHFQQAVSDVADENAGRSGGRSLRRAQGVDDGHRVFLLVAGSDVARKAVPEGRIDNRFEGRRLGGQQLVTSGSSSGSGSVALALQVGGRVNPVPAGFGAF